MSFPFPPRGRKWLPRRGIGEGAWLDFEAAPTRALWKALQAAVGEVGHISKQPSQGHYGKLGQRAGTGATAFRSSPHKGIMERASRPRSLTACYFEAALTRALWKDRHDGGEYLLEFRSSPHKGIMESSSSKWPTRSSDFEAALTRALWKVITAKGRDGCYISKQPSQGHYGKSKHVSH